MALSTLQILSLLNLPKVGPATLFKLAPNFATPNSFSDAELMPLLEKHLISRNNALQNDFSSQWQQAQQSAKEYLESAQRNGITCLNYWEPLFPQALRQILDVKGKENEKPQTQVESNTRGKNKAKTKDKMLQIPVIFYKGDLSLLNEPCVSIIGSRECDNTALKASTYIAEELAKRGICVVSGLALGCDAYAHLGTLNVKGKTIAILGCGLNCIYPEENIPLAEQILAQGGLLLSEYTPDEKVNLYHLVARDFVVAGVAQASVVIASTANGGTMHAAIATANANKSLYVVEYEDPAINEHNTGNKLLATDYHAKWIKSQTRSQLKPIFDGMAQQIKADKAATASSLAKDLGSIYNAANGLGLGLDFE